MEIELGKSASTMEDSGFLAGMSVQDLDQVVAK
jgi:hypothetical protein